MISPKPLKRGDKVGIVATARKVSEDQIRPAIQILESWGLEVILSPMLFQTSHGYLAGTDEERIAAFQQFLDHPDLDAILCARGGYGTTRIIDELRFDEFSKHPKWVVGFSDVTALHLRLARMGFESIHGIMPLLFSKDGAESSVAHLHDALFGEPLQLTADANQFNHHGKATGKLIGGNLSLLVDSLGSPDQPETKGKILVVEEVDEYLYKIDRMFVQLKRAGKLDALAGLIVGHFTDAKDSDLKFGESVEEIIRTHTRIYSYPVAFGFPTGHENPNHSWIHGREAVLIVNENGSTLNHSLQSDIV